jgi:hypothetical protein
MKNKNFITIGLLLFCSCTFGQIGVNNQNPQATIDIAAKTTNGNKPEGIIAPRLTGDQIKLGDAQYGLNQKGTLIYATSAVTSASSKTVNIKTEGYYYFDGSIWQKVGSWGAYVWGADKQVKGLGNINFIPTGTTITNYGNTISGMGGGSIDTTNNRIYLPMNGLYRVIFYTNFYLGTTTDPTIPKSGCTDLNISLFGPSGNRKDGNCDTFVTTTTPGGNGYMQTVFNGSVGDYISVETYHICQESVISVELIK